MRRLLVAAIVMLGWPVVAAAQTSALAPLPPLPPIGLPLPQITAPLTPIALPLTPIGFPAQTDTRVDRSGHPPQRHRSRFDGRRGGFSHPTIVFVVPMYDWGVSTSLGAPRPGAIVPEPTPEPPVTPPVDATPVSEVAPAATADPLSAPAEPPPPSTFYFIPGCYMGNVPPEQVVLPPKCDRTRVITRTP